MAASRWSSRELDFSLQMRSQKISLELQEVRVVESRRLRASWGLAENSPETSLSQSLKAPENSIERSL